MDTATVQPPATSHSWFLAEVASFCRVHPKTIQAWVRTQGFPRPYRIGRKLLWDPKLVREFVARKAAEVAPPTEGVTCPG